MRYKIIEDLTSDVMFEAYGKNLKEVFSNSALALLSIICQIKKVKPKTPIKIKVSSSNEKELMFSLLQEIIALVDVKEMFFSKITITKITKTNLEAKLYGEPISPEKGEIVVKALTNYKFDLRKTDKGYKAIAVLDI